MLGEKHSPKETGIKGTVRRIGYSDAERVELAGAAERPPGLGGVVLDEVVEQIADDGGCRPAALHGGHALAEVGARGALGVAAADELAHGEAADEPHDSGVGVRLLEGVAACVRVVDDRLATCREERVEQVVVLGAVGDALVEGAAQGRVGDPARQRVGRCGSAAAECGAEHDRERGAAEAALGARQVTQRSQLPAAEEVAGAAEASVEELVAADAVEQHRPPRLVVHR